MTREMRSWNIRQLVEQRSETLLKHTLVSSEKCIVQMCEECKAGGGYYWITVRTPGIRHKYESSTATSESSALAGAALRLKFGCGGADLSSSAAAVAIVVSSCRLYEYCNYSTVL